jgi:hypothetical protein
MNAVGLPTARDVAMAARARVALLAASAARLRGGVIVAAR